jgi:hypothetical protein
MRALRGRHGYQLNLNRLQDWNMTGTARSDDRLLPGISEYADLGKAGRR